MDIFYKKISDNQYQYYPEKKKSYSVNDGKPKTRSGKVECHLPNLAKKGIDPMPIWRDEYLLEIPQDKFLMLTGRHAQFTQSGTANNSVLRDLMPENYLWINRRVANRMGIEFGEKVKVTSKVGSVTIRAYPTEKIAPNQLFFVHGFGEESSELTWAYRNGASDNEIIDDAIEPIYGAAAMHETFVEVIKI